MAPASSMHTHIHTHTQNSCRAIKKQPRCWLAPILKVVQPAGPQHMGPIMTSRHTMQGMRAKFTWELISFLHGSRSSKHWRKWRKQRSAQCLPSQLLLTWVASKNFIASQSVAYCLLLWVCSRSNTENQILKAGFTSREIVIMENDDPGGVFEFSPSSRGPWLINVSPYWTSHRQKIKRFAFVINSGKKLMLMTSFSFVVFFPTS